MSKAKAGVFFNAVEYQLRDRVMFFIGQIHDMNHSSLLNHTVMTVPDRSAVRNELLFPYADQYNQG